MMDQQRKILKTLQMGEAALTHLGVTYRMVPLSGGALFFCQRGSLTFNLLLRDGVSRVWKLLCTEEAPPVGSKLVFQSPAYPQSFGFVVEEPGVVNCWLEQPLGGSGDLVGQIQGFLEEVGGVLSL
ncbi:MAG: hypothetical protein LUD84_01890 [Clostridiales bacterium]|nr:hypothetical protein [Clostridiales bacterium]